MIYLKHNFVQNIKSADGTNDNSMKTDIILSELAKLISVKPELVITYLRGTGFKVSDNIGSRALTKKVVEAIQTSPNFTALMAKEMVGIGPSKNPNFNNDGGGWQNVDWGALTQQTLNLVKDLKNTFGKDKNKGQSGQNQQQLQQNVNTINQMTGQGMSTQTKVLIGVAIAVPLLIGGFFAIRALRS